MNRVKGFPEISICCIVELDATLDDDVCETLSIYTFQEIYILYNYEFKKNDIIFLKCFKYYINI